MENANFQLLNLVASFFAVMEYQLYKSARYTQTRVENAPVRQPTQKPLRQIHPIQKCKRSRHRNETKCEYQRKQIQLHSSEVAGTNLP